MQKRLWGCNAPPEKGYEVTLEGEAFDRCPNRPLIDDSEFFSKAFTYYNWYKKGFLPSEGSWLDQTEAFVELVSVMDSASSAADEILKQRDEEKRMFYNKLQKQKHNNRRV